MATLLEDHQRTWRAYRNTTNPDHSNYKMLNIQYVCQASDRVHLRKLRFSKEKRLMCMINAKMKDLDGAVHSRV